MVLGYIGIQGLASKSPAVILPAPVGNAADMQVLMVLSPNLFLTCFCDCCTGVLVLEELEHAKARGVPILAEYLGGSFTCDAYNMTEPLPNGKGVSSCIER